MIAVPMNSSSARLHRLQDPKLPSCSCCRSPPRSQKSGTAVSFPVIKIKLCAGSYGSRVEACQGQCWRSTLGNQRTCAPIQRLREQKAHLDVVDTDHVVVQQRQVHLSGLEWMSSFPVRCSAPWSSTSDLVTLIKIQ